MQSVLQDSIQFKSAVADSISQDTLVAADIKPIVSEILELADKTSWTESFLIPQPPTPWILVVLGSLILAYAIGRIVLGKFLVSTFLSAIRYNTAVAQYQDNSQTQKQRDTFLYALYFLSIGLFLYHLQSRHEAYPFNLQGFMLYIGTIGFLFGIFVLRIIVLGITGFVFDRLSLYKAYLYHSFNYNKLLGIIFIPIDLVLIYSGGIFHEVAYYGALSIFIVLIIMRLIRGFVFAIKSNIFNFYLFLYLCALEIVPVLLLVKWYLSILA